MASKDEMNNRLGYQKATPAHIRDLKVLDASRCFHHKHRQKRRLAFTVVYEAPAQSVCLVNTRPDCSNAPSFCRSPGAPSVPMQLLTLAHSAST